MVMVVGRMVMVVGRRRTTTTTSMVLLRDGKGGLSSLSACHVIILSSLTWTSPLFCLTEMGVR